MIMEKHEKFILWCDKAMAFCFYALIYFIPISIALSETFTGTAFFFYLLKRGAVFYGYLRSENQQIKNVFIFFRKLGEAYKPVPSTLNTAIVFILIISFVSVIRSQYLLLSVEGFVGKVLQSVFLYFNFIECMGSKKRLKKFMTVFLVSFTLICINGIYQSIVGHGFIFGHNFDGRLSSSLRHANDFAAYLIVVVPVLFFLVFLNSPQKQSVSGKTDEFTFLTQHRNKLICLMSFLFGFVCLGLTLSRGAWLGFITSLVLMSLFGLRKRKVIVANSLLIIFFIVIFYPGLFVNQKILLKKNLETFLIVPVTKFSFFLTNNFMPVKRDHGKQENVKIDQMESSQTVIGNRFHMDSYGKFVASNNRLGYWKRSFKIIRDYPIFGCGLNTYARVEGRYNVGWGGYPHNSYLQMAAETGLAGITVFLWMLFVLFRDSLKALWRIKNQEQILLLFGFMTGLLGFLIHSFFDTNFYSVQLSSLLWIIMGVVVVLQKIELD